MGGDTKDFELASSMTEAELDKILAGVDPNDLGRPFSQEELGLIAEIQALARSRKGPSTFVRHDQYARHRRNPRGDRHKVDGKKVGPRWAHDVVFKDDDNKVVDIEATNFQRARRYLLTRRLPANRASNLKKLGKAARILQSATV